MQNCYFTRSCLSCSDGWMGIASRTSPPISSVVCLTSSIVICCSGSAGLSLSGRWKLAGKSRGRLAGFVLEGRCRGLLELLTYGGRGVGGYRG